MARVLPDAHGHHRAGDGAAGQGDPAEGGRRDAGSTRGRRREPTRRPASAASARPGCARGGRQGAPQAGCAAPPAAPGAVTRGAAPRFALSVPGTPGRSLPLCLGFRLQSAKCDLAQGVSKIGGVPLQVGVPLAAPGAQASLEHLGCPMSSGERRAESRRDLHPLTWGRLEQKWGGTARGGCASCQLTPGVPTRPPAQGPRDLTRQAPSAEALVPLHPAPARGPGHPGGAGSGVLQPQRGRPCPLLPWDPWRARRRGGPGHSGGGGGRARRAAVAPRATTLPLRPAGGARCLPPEARASWGGVWRGCRFACRNLEGGPQPQAAACVCSASDHRSFLLQPTAETESDGERSTGIGRDRGTLLDRETEAAEGDRGEGHSAGETVGAD